jgi:hypothetical protein
MAAIDFPTSPTTGQLFAAANGVTYMYNGTLWLVQAGPGGGTGDFAASAASVSLPTSAGVPTLAVIQGNAGAYFNPANTRYTPPAGKYYLYAYMSGSLAGAATNLSIVLRKNGTVLPSASSQITTAAAGFVGNVSCDMNVDANGSDYFDITVVGTPATTNGINIVFGAFPLTGMQGPMGSPFGGGTGDFCALLTGPTALPTTASIATTMPVVSGNSGGWYVPATGRYTPPVGRYMISASMFGTNPSAISNLNLDIRKNGVGIQSSVDTTPTSNNWANVSCDIIADANGSDFFDVRIAGTVAGTTGTNITFQAFPLTGMQGPAGPVGLLSGAGAPSMSATKGTLYTNTTATTTTTRLYINIDGATTWANFTASA